jgi:hypothetical protein
MFRNGNGAGSGSGITDAGYSSDASCYLDGGSCLPPWSQKTARVEVDSSNDYTALLDQKYAASLAGIAGELDGLGEWAATKDVRNPSEIRAESNTGELTAWGRSWGLDSPATDSKSNKSSVFAEGGNSSTSLKPADSHFCYLTHVSGQFDGMGEAAYVDLKAGRWRLNVRSGCKESGGFVGLGPSCERAKPMKAVANCYKYDQR